MRNLILFLIVFFIQISSSSAISVVLTKRNPACGFSNGNIKAWVSSTIPPPFTFQWSNSAVTDSIYNLAPGTYTVTVTDNSGASTTASATLVNTPYLENAHMTFVVPGQMNGITYPCTNQCNGTAYLSGETNGTPPFWTTSSAMNHVPGVYPGSQIPTLSNICANDFFTVTVVDMNGCSGIASMNPLSVSYLTPILNITPACNGANNGQMGFHFQSFQSFDITVSDSAALQYNQTNILTTTTFSGLHPGNWQVTITNTMSTQPCDTTYNVFVPDAGSNCGIINGSVYLDTVANCVKSLAEPLIPNRLIEITPGPLYVNTDANGNYSLLLPFNNYTLKTLPGPDIHPACPPLQINLNSGNSFVTGADLGDSALYDLNLSVTLASGAARPGFNYTQYLHVRNSSFQASAGAQLSLMYDAQLTLNSVSIPYTVVGPGEISVNIPAMGSFSEFDFNVNYTIPANQALIGTTLTTIATITAQQPEQFLADNSDTLYTVVTGSFDPNDKQVWPDNDPQHHYFMDIEDELRYTIRFQNTGTDTAFTVVIVDTLDTMLDLSSIRVLGTSHPCTWEIKAGRVLTITYNNILLADSNINEPESHGLFSFAIAPLENSIVIPYVLNNTAAIYFDFNLPVITNTAFSTMDMSVGMNEISGTSTLKVFPNPVTGDFRIILPASNNQADQLVLFNTLGQEVDRINVETTNRNEPIVYYGGFLTPGIYYLKSVSGSTSEAVKIVKL